MYSIQEKVSSAITTSELLNQKERIGKAINITQLNNLSMCMKQPIKASILGSIQRSSRRQEPRQTMEHNNSTQLKKGQRITISSQQIIIGTKWLTKDPHYDLDVSCFALTNTGKVLNENYFIFYGNLSSPDNSVRLISESFNRKTGDCKEFSLDFHKVDSAIERFIFALTINEALEHGYNFSKVSNAIITIRDMTRKGIFEFALTDCYEKVTSIVMGEVYQKNDQWKFHSVSSGITADLAGLCTRYGVEIG